MEFLWFISTLKNEQIDYILDIWHIFITALVTKYLNEYGIWMNSRSWDQHWISVLNLRNWVLNTLINPLLLMINIVKWIIWINPCIHINPITSLTWIIVRQMYFLLVVYLTLILQGGEVLLMFHKRRLVRVRCDNWLECLSSCIVWDISWLLVRLVLENITSVEMAWILFRLFGSHPWN